jgi:hypothetical protein
MVDVEVCVRSLEKKVKRSTRAEGEEEDEFDEDAEARESCFYASQRPGGRRSMATRGAASTLV